MGYLIVIFAALAAALIVVTVVLLWITAKNNRRIRELSDKSLLFDNMEKLLQSMDTLIVITEDESDKIIFMNERMKKNFGFDDSVIGRKCWEILGLNGVDRCEFCPKSNPGFNPGDPASWEFRSPITDRDYRIICRFIDWPDGTKVFMEQCDDITELKESIARLREAETRTQLMLDSSPLGINLFNADREIIDCNLEAMNMFGISDRDEYRARFSSLSPEYQPNGNPSLVMADELFRKAFYEEEYCRFEWEHQKPDGGLLPCEVTFVRSQYKGQDVVVAYMHDLREMKSMIAHLSKMDEYTELMLNAMPHACTLWDEDLNAIKCNQAALKMRGVKDLRDYNERHAELMPEFQPDGTNSMEKRRRLLQTALDDGYYQCEWMYRAADGTPLPCEVTLVRIIHNDRYAVAEYIRDLRVYKAFIEEIEKTQNDLRAALDAAQAANRAKTVFLANVSHEIRTPMNSILGFSELAREDQIPTRTKGYLEHIFESAEWLINIINDILDISKIEAGKMVLDQVAFDIHDIFTHCRTIGSVKAEEKGVQLYCYAEPSVGKKIIGDPVRLCQALLNLLSNAIKFTNVGIIKLLASVVNFDVDKTTIRFEVKDSGIGMNAEQIAKIFEPFSQVDSDITRKYGGPGLGLTITKTIVEMMGGTLEVESTPGIGSKFSFEITFDMIDAPDSAQHHKISPVRIKKPRFEGEVLICEDNNLNQQVICEHLARVGIKTVVAHNGREGVEIVQERLQSGNKPFDLIFMDIHMPVMDGLEAAVQITATGVKTPIMALTANIMINDLELYKTSGMVGYLSKPFTSQELWRCLMNFMQPVSVSAADSYSEEDDDEELLKRLRLNFVKSSRNILNDIKRAVAEGDIKLAHRIVHTLKSNAGQIGEKRLQSAAAAAEGMLKNETNLLTDEQMRVLETELNALLHKLGPMLEEDGGETVFASGETVISVLERIEPMLINRNPECMDMLDDVRAIPGCEELARLMDDFEFKRALEVLMEIKRSYMP